MGKKRGRKPGGSYAAMAGYGGSTTSTPPPPIENEYGPSAFVSGAAFEPPSAANGQKTGPKFGPRISSLEEEMDMFQEKIDGLSYENKVLMAQLTIFQDWVIEEFGKLGDLVIG